MQKSCANVLIGGKMGDFIHCMYVPYHLWKSKNIKSNIFISPVGDVFEHGFQKTFDELTPVIMQQEYVESFQIWNGQDIDYFTPLFRHRQYICINCWKAMLCSIFFKDEKPLEGGWMTFNEPHKLEKTLIINRKNKNIFAPIIKNSYELEITKFSNVIFAGEEIQFKEFSLNNLCKYYPTKTLTDWFSIISKGSFFLGNQSGPAAIACALDVPRLIELMPTSDAIHYFNESLYSKNISFINPSLCQAR